MKLLKMQQLDDDDEELAYSTTTGKGGAGKITDMTDPILKGPSS